MKYPDPLNPNTLTGPTKVAVNERTVLVRVNRALAKTSDLIIRKYRVLGQRAKSESGDYYQLDQSSGQVVEMHVDLESLAREIGVLRCFEELAYAPHPQHDLLEGMRGRRRLRPVRRT